MAGRLLSGQVPILLARSLLEIPATYTSSPSTPSTPPKVSWGYLTTIVPIMNVWTAQK